MSIVFGPVSHNAFPFVFNANVVPSKQEECTLDCTACKELDNLWFTAVLTLRKLVITLVASCKA